MAAKVIDGVAIAREVRRGIAARAQALTDRGTQPSLVVIIVGDDPASAIYVRNKVRACGDVGIKSAVVKFPIDVAEARLLEKIRELNDDPTVHGILIQLPLPPS